MSIDQIELREKIPLLDLPWGDGKDWTVVDLWEDYEEDLLDAFYRKYMTTQFGTSDGTHSHPTNQSTIITTMS